MHETFASEIARRVWPYGCSEDVPWDNMVHQKLKDQMVDELRNCLIEVGLAGNATKTQARNLVQAGITFIATHGDS